MFGSEQQTTRSALLSLQEEQGVVQEAYEFLDEKRLLIAAELLKQVSRYEQLRLQQDALQQRAAEALRAAISCHGMQGLSVYPAQNISQWQLEKSRKNFMGVYLLETQLVASAHDDEAVNKPVYPTPEAGTCRGAWQDLLKLNAEIAGVSVSIHRLLAEYRKTERRARALENIILPELKQLLAEITTHLEEIDQEEAIRTHLKYGETQ